MEGTVPRADLEVPGEVLDRLTFRSQRGERPLKQVKDGELTSSLALQGIYRLADGSAADFASLIETPPPASTARIPRPSGKSDRRIGTPDEALF
jgi:hypothetical protein